MFQHYFYQNFEDVFEIGKTPKVSRLSLIMENQHWSHSYHIHEEDTELVYIAKDRSLFTVDSVEYTRQAGDMLIIEPGTVHSLMYNSGEIWSCQIHGYKIKGMKENTMLKDGVSPVFCAGEHRGAIESVIVALNAMKHSTCNASIYGCHTLIAIMAAMYYEIFQSANKQEIDKPCLFINQILAFLNDNYTKSLTLQLLADKFKVSPSYISHEFAKKYHISPINYIIERRINEAKVLLINTESSINDIAGCVGYEDVNHFIKIFIKKVGSKPTEYRNYYKQKSAVL